MGSLFNNTDDLLKYLAEQSKIYIDQAFEAGLSAQTASFQSKIDSDLIQLNTLITALEDLSFTNDNTVDVDALVAQVATNAGAISNINNTLTDLDQRLLQEISDRIALKYPTGFTEDDFNNTKYKTIFELSINLKILEDIVAGIQINGTGGETNIQADWNEDDPNSDAYIKNKPKWIQSTKQFYEWQGDTLIRYDVYGDNLLWKVEKFSEGISLWHPESSGNFPDTLAKCQLLTYQ